jgi:hypothetical protein
MVPVIVDARFSREEIKLPSATVEVRARKARVRLALTGPSVVRDSRYGDYLNSPYITAEIIESARKTLETESGAQVAGEFGIVRGLYSRLTSHWYARRTKKSTHENDNLVKVAVKEYRVVYRGGNCWEITEPAPPRILTGKYLGEVLSSREGDRSDPLCFLTFSKDKQTADLWLSVDRNDLDFRIVTASSSRSLSRNREAIVAEMLRRSIPPSSFSNLTIPPFIAASELVLGHSRMEATHAD